MNLHAIVRGAITAVNPYMPGTFRSSTGYTQNGAKRVPTYNDIPNVRMQVQPMSSKDLQLVDSLNLTGYQRAIYVDGKFDGVVRPLVKGGDLCILATGPNAGVWKVVMVLEQWPDWCKLAVTLQNDPLPTS